MAAGPSKDAPKGCRSNHLHGHVPYHLPDVDDLPLVSHTIQALRQHGCTAALAFCKALQAACKDGCEYEQWYVYALSHDDEANA